MRNKHWETAMGCRRRRRRWRRLQQLVPGCGNLHGGDASRKCGESSRKKMLLFFLSLPPFYYAPLLQQGPLPVWHFQSSWGESSPSDNETERSTKKVRETLEDRRGKVCQPDRQEEGQNNPLTWLERAPPPWSSDGILLVTFPTVL